MTTNEGIEGSELFRVAGWRRDVELVIFDWDGTVIDSVGSVLACMEAAFQQLGLKSPGPVALRQSIGLGLRSAASLVLSEDDEAGGSGAERVDAWVRAYQDNWFGGLGEQSVPFHRAEDTLRELRESGRVLAIATGKSRRGLMRDLERTGLADFFLATRTPDDGPSKPHPWMTESILDELGVRPGRAVVIGDSEHDLRMATAAGVAAVGVLRGAAPREVLEKEKPAALLPDLTSLPAWLAGS